MWRFATLGYLPTAEDAHLPFNRLLDRREVLLGVSLAVKAHIVNSQPAGGRQPSVPLRSIHFFIGKMMMQASLKSHNLICSLVLLERLSVAYGSADLMTPSSWKVAFLMCCVVATKATEDALTFNADFAGIVPALPMSAMLIAETRIMEFLGWTARVSPQEYGLYYFALKDSLFEACNKALQLNREDQDFFSETYSEGDHLDWKLCHPLGQRQYQESVSGVTREEEGRVQQALDTITQAQRKRQNTLNLQEHLSLRGIAGD